MTTLFTNIPFFPIVLAPASTALFTAATDPVHVANAFPPSAMASRTSINWMFAVFAIMVWQFWIFVAQTKAAGTTTYILAIPLWPWWGLATVLLTLCLPVHAVVVMRELVAAVRGTDAVAETEQAL